MIDEWVAVWLLCLIIPFSYLSYFTATVLFRIFDISKIWPVSWCEQLPGAWGIMLDDVMAAFLVAAVVILGQMFLPL